MTECLRSRYYALRNYMVYVACKSAFFGTPLIRKLYQGKAFGSSCTFALQLCSKLSVSVPDALYMSTRIAVAFAVNGYVHNAHIYPKPTFLSFPSMRVRRFGRF